MRGNGWVREYCVQCGSLWVLCVSWWVVCALWQFVTIVCVVVLIYVYSDRFWILDTVAVRGNVQVCDYRVRRGRSWLWCTWSYIHVCLHIHVYTCDAWQRVSSWVLCASWQFMTSVYVVVHICRFARIYVHHCHAYVHHRNAHVHYCNAWQCVPTHIYSCVWWYTHECVRRRTQQPRTEMVYPHI